MNAHATDVSRYLDAMSFARGQAEGGRTWGAAPFVTISREPGAGGHALADALIQELGLRAEHRWTTFDQELLELVEQDPSLRESLDSILKEEYLSGGSDLLNQVFWKALPQDVALSRVFRGLRALAGAGGVVILGRGGVCLTRDLPGGIHVRLAASPASRLRRAQERWGLPRAAAERKLRELELSRAAMVRDHFGQDVADPLLYDAVWNADRVSFDEIARWTADRVEEKAAALRRLAP